MKMLLKQIHFENFKSFTEVTVNFNEILTVIKGDNETGKSTIFDGFMWVLTGKNSLGETSFEIKPNFIGDFVSPAVTLELEIDGKPVTLKRVQQAKFSRSGEFNKYTTECYKNDIPMGVKEFEQYIFSIAENEQNFKLLSNIKYFTELMIASKGKDITTQKREMLLDMAGVQSDIEFANADEKYADISKEFDRYDNIYELQKAKKKALSKLDEDTKSFKDKAEQQAKNFINVDFDIEKVKQEEQALLEQKKQLNNSVSELNNNNTLVEINKQIEGITEQLEELENSNRIFAKQQEQEQMQEFYKKREEMQNNINSLVAETEKSKREKFNAVGDIDFKIKGIEMDIQTVNTHISSMRIKAKNLIEKEKTVDTVCPTCNQALPQDKIDSAKAEYQKQLDELTNSANELKEKVSKLEKEKELLLDKKQKANEIVVIDNTDKIAELKEKLSNMQVPTIGIRDIDNYTEDRDTLQAQISTLKAEFEQSNISNRNKINSTTEQIQAIDEQLKEYSRYEVILLANSRCQDEMTKLENSHKESVKAKDECVNILEQIKDFITSKCKVDEEKVNSMFEKTRFKLFEKNSSNDDIKNICVPMYNGTEYNSLSNSGKIVCSLDIVKGFQKHYNMYLPIFIDNKECITTDFENLENQVVTMSVVEEKCSKCGSDKTGRRTLEGYWICADCGNKFKKILEIK